jgi:hypothetical protein
VYSFRQAAQAKKIDNLSEMIFKADKCVITALLYRLPAGGVIRNGLAVIKHFIPVCCSSQIKSGASAGRFA